MSGYRQHSFDPNAYEQPGPPLRPYNWVQWAGVAIGSVGAVLVTLHFGGRLGWIPQWVDDPSPASLMLLLLGFMLVNSRRQPATMVGSEQLQKNRNLLLITLVAGAVMLGAAILIEFQGA